MNWATLRIAIVGPLSPPAGGMAGQTAQLTDCLRKEGANVRLVQTNQSYWPAWVSGIRGVRAIARLIGYIARLWSAAGEVQIFHIMANSGWSWHLFAVPAIWIGHLRSVRVVVNYHGGDARRFLDRSWRWVRPTLSVASALVLPSPFLLQVFREFGYEGVVIPNTIDFSRFGTANGVPGCLTIAATAGQSYAPSGAIVFVPRNLELIYDNATALRAFARLQRELPSSKLVVAGSGSEESNLKALASVLGVAASVEFTGHLDREQMAKRYGRASVILNPSRVDNAPISLIEALACGVPIVSTNVGGIPLLVEHERTALLVPPGDAEAMAAALLRLQREPGLAGQLRAAGLIEVQRYSWPQVKDALGALYQSLLAPERASEQSA